jgi:RHS repeat-associated protein
VRGRQWIGESNQVVEQFPFVVAEVFDGRLAEQGGDHARVVGQVGGIGHVSCLVAVHKLTSVKVTGGGGARDHTYVYDASNRLVNIKNTVGGATVVGLGYDPQGNLANKNGQTYSFTYGNRLRAAPGKETYLYDGHGRRVESRTTNYSVWQYSQSGQVMYSRDARNNRKTNYIYLGGSLVALREQPMSGGTTAAVKYQHTDALGTPVAVTDAAKAIVETFEYEPYGQLVNSTLKDGPGFTGHVQDAATGLTYMQQRYYDPQVGRFLSSDPVTAYDNPISGFNRYRYAANNPYRFVDPDGRIDWRAFGDSFKLEVALGLSLEAKVKVGPVKVSLGAGSATYGGGATLAPDVYAFEEVASPSAAIEMGDYAAGYVGSSERSYQGRNGEIYSEESSPSGGVLGRKSAELSANEEGAELSGSVGAVIIKATGSIDLGKAFKALTGSRKEDGAHKGNDSQQLQVKLPHEEGR